jgi:CRP-like cAMP-binding protein
VPPRQASRAATLLDSSQDAKSLAQYGRGETIFSQGEAGDDVLYIRRGGVRLYVRSKTGKEAVSATLGRGDFFGEGCLAGESNRTCNATAIARSTIVSIGKVRMVRVLRTQPEMADRFITHLLARNTRLEEDLIDQLFNSNEKRLARTLLLLARYGTEDAPIREVPMLSQETLAEMIGSTRTRVRFFLDKFKRLGFVDYKAHGPLRINSSLLGVVLRD